MKNLLRISFLLLLVFALFVSCGEKAGGGNTGETPLFSESETPITIGSFSMSDLADGEWELKHTFFSTYSDHIQVSNGGDSITVNVQSWTLTIEHDSTISGGIETSASGTSTSRYAMDNANKAQLEAFLTSHNISATWEGNTFVTSYTITTPITSWLDSMIDDSSSSSSTTKTNSTHTQFIVVYNNNNNNLRSYYYLKKK